MTCIYGLPKTVLYVDEVFMTKKVVSHVMPLVVMSNLMLSLSPLSFSSNPIKVVLNLSNYDQLIPITFRVNHNIIFAELPLISKVMNNTFL